MAPRLPKTGWLTQNSLVSHVIREMHMYASNSKEFWVEIHPMAPWRWSSSRSWRRSSRRMGPGWSWARASPALQRRRRMTSPTRREQRRRWPWRQTEWWRPWLMLLRLLVRGEWCVETNWAAFLPSNGGGNMKGRGKCVWAGCSLIRKERSPTSWYTSPYLDHTSLVVPDSTRDLILSSIHVETLNVIHKLFE